LLLTLFLAARASSRVQLSPSSFSANSDSDPQRPQLASHAHALIQDQGVQLFLFNILEQM
jgi:hypothetical protein